jgi:rare lipoprotein A
VSSRRLRVSGGLAGGLLAGLAVGTPVLAMAETPRAPALEVSAGQTGGLAAQTIADPKPIAPRATERASRSLPRTPLRTARAKGEFSGLASWYGGSFHGRRTASGEVFDASGLTAASRTLPFGTRLRVCRLERCVVVRINDRGPFVGHRVLDLSHGASRVLGFSGVAFVTATPVPERVAPRARRARTAPPVRRAAIPAVLALPAAVPASNVPVLAQVAPAAETVPPVLGLFGAGFVGTAACGFRGSGRPRLFPCP